MGYYGRGLFTVDTSGGRGSNYYLYQTVNQLLLKGEQKSMKINLETEEIKSVLLQFEREAHQSLNMKNPGKWIYIDEWKRWHDFRTLDEAITHFLEENKALEFQLLPVQVDNALVVGYRLLMKVNKK
mgnify:CR=1 FL=1